MRFLNILHSSTILFIFFSVQILFSKQYSDVEINNIANDFLNKRILRHKNTLKKQFLYRIDMIEQLKDPENNQVLAHVVHVQPKGFLIISGSTVSNPVVAYSFQHDLNYSLNTNNAFYKFILGDLRSRSERSDNIDDYVSRNIYNGSNTRSISENTIDRKFYQWPEKGATETGGWLETMWHQGDPYNQFCPIDRVYDEKRSAIGCIATAMAQVVHYNRYLGVLRFDQDDRYTTTSRGIYIDGDSSEYHFPGFQRLNNYLDQIKIKYKSNEPLNAEEISTLCFACGISIGMDYTKEASAISESNREVAHALKYKMGYHSADFQIENKKFYHKLIENLMNGLPVILFLSDHAIVADGYNTDGFFHLNFGWRNGIPKMINETWYRPDELPNNYDRFRSGILNINPTANQSDPKISCSDSIIYLPGAKIGEKSDIKQFTLLNNSNYAVNIDDILTTRNFYVSISGDDFGQSLHPAIMQPGERLDVYIRCIPEEVGQLDGDVHVLASCRDIKQFIAIELFGYGVPNVGTTINSENVSGVWKKDESPYYICNDIKVSPGSKLKIAPGTEVIFLGSFQLSIENNAQLIAKGTPSDSIYFKSLNISTGWKGIRFIDSSNDDELSYIVVRQCNSTSEQSPIYVYLSSPAINHSKIANNQSYSYSGAIYLSQSPAVITHTILENNICHSDSGAGALFMDRSSPVISNVVFSKNESICGGTISGINSSAIITNITMTGNEAHGIGGAIFLNGGNYFDFKNSVIWNNEAKLGSSLAFGKGTSCDTVSISYSNIDTTSGYWLYMRNTSEQFNKILWGNGNICSNPFFKDLKNNDFTFESASSCIDAGDPLDEVGEEPNPNGSRINMGAYGGTSKATKSNILSLTKTNRLSSYKLSQNYPNPFNSMTAINYELPITNYVELNIYNLLGQKVTTLVSGNQNAGMHQVEWDASNLSSGVYYYMIKTGEWQDVKKLELLK